MLLPTFRDAFYELINICSLFHRTSLATMKRPTSTAWEWLHARLQMDLCPSLRCRQPSCSWRSSGTLPQSWLTQRPSKNPSTSSQCSQPKMSKEAWISLVSSELEKVSIKLHSKIVAYPLSYWTATYVKRWLKARRGKMPVVMKSLNSSTLSSNSHMLDNTFWRGVECWWKKYWYHWGDLLS